MTRADALVWIGFWTLDIREPCERCGVPIVVVEYPTGPPAWMEPQHPADAGFLDMVWIAHTPDRCHRPGSETRS